MRFIDTHCHLDGEEFRDDLEAVVARAQEAGVGAIGIPCIDLASCDTVLAMCRRYPGYCHPMLGLHPEEVKEDWQHVLEQIKPRLSDPQVIAIGEVGLDFYWSREFEQAQLDAFEEQVKWSVEFQLPLMIHCRKAQNELVAILKRYKDDLPGGVFHCFTGNETEARQLLEFDNFVLGIGGVLTFKKSHLPKVLPAVVPLDRIVLETDAPYMAPVPMRGKRNESAFIRHIITRLAEAYGVSEEKICRQTNENVQKVFGIQI
jgi:TatD DNase family protein